MIFFISDLHLYDEGILQVTKRPFRNSKEMAMFLRKEWNGKVSRKDTVKILGDAGWVGLYQHPHMMQGFIEFMNSLNGNKELIIGNHDRFNVNVPEFRQCFRQCRERQEMRLDSGQKLFLDHYPLEDWNGMHTGTIHLHGHVHDNPVREVPNRYNVSVDNISYAPVTLEELTSPVIVDQYSYHDRDGVRTIYTIRINNDRYVDVMHIKTSGLIYIMDNPNGGQVFTSGRDFLHEKVDFFEEEAVLSFVRRFSEGGKAHK